PEPRYLLMVLALAGDSTMTTFMESVLTGTGWRAFDRAATGKGCDQVAPPARSPVRRVRCAGRPIRNGAEHGDFAAACQMANWPAWANPLPVRAPLPWIAARSVRSTVPPVTAARDDRLCPDVAARGRSSLLWIKDQAPRRNYLSSKGISGLQGSQPLEARHEPAPGRGSIR